MSTFAQLKTRAQNLALAADDTEAGACVNDALTDIVVTSQLKVTMANESLTSGQSVYDISADFAITDFGALQYLEYLALGATYSYILEPIAGDELLALNATNPIGATRQYAFLGLDTLRLWPVPQTTGDILKVYYAQTPTELTADGDIPSDIPSQWHWLITSGAAARRSPRAAASGRVAPRPRAVAPAGRSFHAMGGRAGPPPDGRPRPGRSDVHRPGPGSSPAT